MQQSFSKKILYIAIGFLATAVGIIGIWLPGIPTVGPILVALWAFSQSSPRLERWLLTMPILKSAILEAKAYQQHRSLTMKTKVIAQVCAWSSVLLVALVTRSIVITVIVALLAISCSVFMVRTSLREPVQPA